MPPKTFILVLVLILVAVALFLIFHDDHDDSYTRSENKSKRKPSPSAYRKSAEPRGMYQAAPQVAPQAPKAAPPTPPRRQGWPEKVLDFDYLLRIPYDPALPERTMSSFIAGLQGFCTPNDLGGVVGYVVTDSVTGAMEVHASDDSLMGFLPMKDRAAFRAFNPTNAACPFAGHIGISSTGRYYADIRIVLPSSHPFVLASLRSFLG